MPKGRGGRHAGVYQQKGRTKQTTAKGKQKGSNAVRRAVNRQIPALKRIANGSHTLRGAWEESGGDPLQWRVAHDSGETIYTDVCVIDQTGVTGLIFGQCDFIDAPFFTVAWSANEDRGELWRTKRGAPNFEGESVGRATFAASRATRTSPPSPSAAAATRGATAARRARSPTGRRATRGSAAKNIKIYYNSPRRRRSRSVTWCL